MTKLRAFLCFLAIFGFFGHNFQQIEFIKKKYYNDKLNVLPCHTFSGREVHLGDTFARAQSNFGLPGPGVG